MISLSFTDIITDDILIFDGAMGTMLQSAGLPGGVLPESFNITHPQVVEEIHRAYVDAGADVVTANTFGANPHKLSSGGYSVEEVISAGIAAAKRSGARFTALDIGPTGKLLEPMGELSFNEAYDIFARQITAGVNAGASLIIIETMSDIYEAKAAVLAAKENSSLPIVATMSYDMGGRTFIGCDAVGATLTLCGLGAHAVGVNCSLGPDEMPPIVETILRHARVPVIVQANAGLPVVSDGIAAYPLGPEEYAAFAQKIARMGVGIIGGCCGTTPEFIRAVKKAVLGISRKMPSPEPHTIAASGTRTVSFDNRMTVIGRGINPFKNPGEALNSEDCDCIIDEAAMQIDAGAQIININIQPLEAGGAASMREIIQSVQSMCSAPLQIGSTAPDIIEAGCRIANGRPIINGTTGIDENMEQIFSIAKRYGALVIGLTIDENGIPQTAQGRLEIAEKIVSKAQMYGIPANDILIDCIVLTSTSNQKQAAQALEAVRMIKTNLPVKIILGAHDAPLCCKALNAEFLIAAIDAGLDAAIVNPLSPHIQEILSRCKTLNC